jgi:hypothetical protein
MRLHLSRDSAFPPILISKEQVWLVGICGLCLFLNLHICVRVSVCAQAFVYIYTCVHKPKCVSIHINMHVLCVHTHPLKSMYVCQHVQVCACLLGCVLMPGARHL